MSAYLDLFKKKCPTKGCGAKMVEVDGAFDLRCEKCGCEWLYAVYGPLDDCWQQRVKPHRFGDDNPEDMTP